jgi:hypothetical protein
MIALWMVILGRCPNFQKLLKISNCGEKSSKNCSKFSVISDRSFPRKVEQ